MKILTKTNKQQQQQQKKYSRVIIELDVKSLIDKNKFFILYFLNIFFSLRAWGMALRFEILLRNKITWLQKSASLFHRDGQYKMKMKRSKSSK